MDNFGFVGDEVSSQATSVTFTCDRRFVASYISGRFKKVGEASHDFVPSYIYWDRRACRWVVKKTHLRHDGRYIDLEEESLV
ncbi:hypothetical protein RR46_06925 [Papilio xuthus]|uniref:Uncharacterized protein n=1 Tax=Papilio xuthus TaxID=66420 RepID=A0A194PRW9_PAPXU|nr:hypothetical protein RR46_06925 [Papilio xuthus]